MRVLVACEFSGIVRRAFANRGHEAWSCDLVPSEDKSNMHIIGDARELLHQKWDLLMVAHPPCTRLCNSGVRWIAERNLWDDLDKAASLFSDFLNAPIDRICVENPVMHKHAKQRIVGYKDFSQSIQPWQFGHPETKRTCLWLRNLKPLIATNIVSGRAARVHRMPPGINRTRERSRFFTGIAAAMAEQWG